MVVKTDNGAQYCFCKSECDQKLLDVSRYLKEDLGIPLQYMSFQNAWWPSTGSFTRVLSSLLICLFDHV